MISCSMNYIFIKSESSSYHVSVYNNDLRTFIVSEPDISNSRTQELLAMDIPVESIWIYNEDYNLKSFTYNENAMLNEVKIHFGNDVFDFEKWQNESCIFLSVDNLYKNSAETFKINNGNFKVIGLCDSYLEKESIIKSSDFISAGLSCNRMFIKLDSSMSVDDINNYHNIIKMVYHESEITDPITRSYALEETFGDTEKIMFFMLLLSVLTESYLLIYLRSKVAYENAVLKILGTTEKKCALFFLCSIIITLEVQNIIGSLLFSKITIPLLGSYDAILLTVFSAKSLILPQILLFVFIVATCIPPLLKKGSKQL